MDAASPLDALAARWDDLPGESLARKPYDRARLDVVLGARAPERPLLELGCRTGQVASYLAAAGAPVLAVEPHPGLLARARTARPHPALEYRGGLYRELHLARGSLGGLVSLLGLAGEPRAALAPLLTALLPALAPGAALLLALYRGTGEEALRLDPAAPPWRVTRWAREELAELLAALEAPAGPRLGEVRVEYRRPYPAEPGGERLYATARVHP